MGKGAARRAGGVTTVAVSSREGLTKGTKGPNKVCGRTVAAPSLRSGRAATRGAAEGSGETGEGLSHNLSVGSVTPTKRSKATGRLAGRGTSGPIGGPLNALTESEDGSGA